MKVNKESRRLARELIRASFTDGQLDSGRVATLVKSLTDKKPRNYLNALGEYQRLLRLEVEKRTATIESASELSPDVARTTVDSLKSKYGPDLTTKFVVNPELLGGMRIRVGSDVWDSSVRNRLQRLQQQL
ncbi:MAG TPA: F0F1 ATP synthase subunit delta [Chthoniobacterales bacterium]|nr:F0F1 ATP synthase subunit delta [Chthoniobacterales bacterium]